MQLAANGDAIVSQAQSYDAVVSLNGYGDVLETTSSNALGHTTKQRTDVGWPLLAVDLVRWGLLMENALLAGVRLRDDARLLKETGRSAHRTAMQSLDALRENFATVFQYDANGNRLSVRDGNNVGQDCVYDVLNRDKQCADTQELRRALVPRLRLGTQGDEALPRVSMSDAKSGSLRIVLEAEPLELAFPGGAWERVGAAGQVVQDIDAKNAITSSTYDTLNRRLTIQWPDHVAGSTLAISTTASKPPPTTPLVEHSASPIGAPSGSGDTISLIYDLAGRMLRREYRSLANSTPLEDGLPTGPVTDQDVFVFIGCSVSPAASVHVRTMSSAR